MFNEKYTDSELIRRLPKTMGTQHPDNASKVPFAEGAYVSSSIEVTELLYNFELGVDEGMWDYEGKETDLRPLRNLLKDHEKYFTENPIGKKFHITPRIPNPYKSAHDPSLYLSTGIFTNSLLVMEQYGLDGQAFTEFIVPDTESGEMMAQLEKDIRDHFVFIKSRFEKYTNDEFPHQGEFFIQGIPLIEDVDYLVHPEKIWDELIRQRQEHGKETYVQRSFIARSDPALKAGMISGILAATIALSKGIEFEKKSGIQIPQIIGAGSAPLRGGLSPDTVDEFLDTYPGVATVTLQSAFRYDYPENTVREAIQRLRHRIEEEWPNRKNPEFSSDEVDETLKIFDRFRKNYISSLDELYDTVIKVSEYVPSNRDRDTAIGPRSYGRQIGGKQWPRAIKTSASFSSLGIPQGLIGTRTFYDLSSDQQDYILASNPMIPFWLAKELELLNSENLDKLNVSQIKEDVESAKEIVRKSEYDFKINERHAEDTSEIFYLINNEKDPTDAINEAARERKFLG